MNSFAFAVTAAALLAAAPAARAAGCMLSPMGALAMEHRADGAVVIPAMIDGASHPMVFDLGEPDSVMRRDFAAANRLEPTNLPGHIATVYRGLVVHEEVLVPRLQYGAMSGTQVPTLLVPATGTLPGGTVGAIGSRLLSNSDVEIDFAAGTIRLWSPDHCPGAVVHWTDTAAIIPFDYGEDGRILFDMELDGQHVRVALGLGKEGAMRLSAVRRMLGDTPLSPSSFTPAGDVVYRHPFHTLSMGGITLNSPNIAIVDDEHRLGCTRELKPAACFDRADLDLGLGQLAGLHLYFAFAEKKLYATAAGAHK